VLAAWDQHLVDPYLPRTLTGSLSAAGFAVDRPRVIPLFNDRYDLETYSAGMLEIVALFVAGRDGIRQTEAEAWAEDLRSLGPDYFFSLNRYLFSATKPA
jgi:hypothetical protein